MTLSQSASAAPVPVVADLNPIAWAQFHLRGGWKSFWSTTIGYTVIVGAGLLLAVRLTDATPGALGAVKTAFTGLQAGLMVIFVSSRVSTAVRQDQTSRMIESHRLMPVSPSQAVLGYLAGPSAQPMAICIANVLLGCAVSRVVGTPVSLWLTVNAILFLFAAFAAVLSAFGVFAGKPSGAAVGWIGMFVGLMNFVTIGAILPAVNVLATPLLGNTVFNLGVSGGDAVAVYAPSTVLQAWIAAVCFAGACRRYRRDDRPALGWDLGLALLGAWVVTSIVGIKFWDDFGPAMMKGRPVHPAAQFMGSTVSSMLLALVPLAGSAWLSADWDHRRAMRDPTLGRRPPAPPLVAMAAAAITLLLTTASAVPVQRYAEFTFLLVASFYLATSYVFRILARVTTKTLYPLLVWLLVAWLLPMGVDYLRWWLRGLPSEPTLGTASAFGALGALIEVCTDDARRAVPGIIFQAGLAALVAVVYYATRHRFPRRPDGTPQ